MSAYSFFAPCPRGVEPYLADELRRLGLRSVRPQRGGVLFAGRITAGYRALLWSRLASRVLLSLGDVDASSADTLYEGVKAIAWEDHLAAEGTLAVDSSGVNDALRNTQFTAVRVKDAIVDRFRERTGTRPSVETTAPDLRINAVVTRDKVKLAIDLSGEPLHRRGYRTQGIQVAAPMKETLAAALLEVAGWRDIAAAGGGFADPMCGSATIAIEAAWMAADTAPGLRRARWGFDRWLGHDESAWNDLLDDADARCEAGLETLGPILASDSDPAAVEIAEQCIRKAGLAGRISLATLPLSQAGPPASTGTGLVACNPPYGERLSQRSELSGLYGQLAALMRGAFGGWELAVITPDPQLAPALGEKPARAHELYNGKIPVLVSVFGGFSASPEHSASSTPLAPQLSAPDASAQAFENRLRKMAKHLGSWARKTGVTCYRVYDADLPDYNLAVDLYTGAGDDAGKRYAHIAEYAPPTDVDPHKAAQRMEWAREAVAGVLGIDEADVFVKRRERKRGSAQYERLARTGTTVTVGENGLLFEVNLSDFLDTGLFLDHRDTRARVRELAAGARFLNLFAYTGTASVYAAAGGAVSTTTVDLSATYLEWAGRNMSLNGGSGPQHSRVQADVMRMLDTARRNGNRYELIFCDPPTFSNSKRMDDTWDVQRDHVALIAAAARVLAPGGTLIFSCNRKKFVLDEAALADAGLVARDVTRATIPKDFERTPKVHACWLITHAHQDDPELP